MNRNNESFEKDFKAASGNMIHEGMKCNDEEKELIRLKYLGKITEEEFIKRVLNQTKKIDEIIICDDGSKDNTLKICDKILKNSNVTYSIKINKKLGFI